MTLSFLQTAIFFKKKNRRIFVVASHFLPSFYLQQSNEELKCPINNIKNTVAGVILTNTKVIVCNPFCCFQHQAQFSLLNTQICKFYNSKRAKNVLQLLENVVLIYFFSNRSQWCSCWGLTSAEDLVLYQEFTAAGQSRWDWLKINYSSSQRWNTSPRNSV